MKEQARNVDPESVVAKDAQAGAEDDDLDVDRERAIVREAGAIPSTLDPSADIEPIDSDMNLDGLPADEQDYPMDNRTEAVLPEEQIGEMIADAAEGIPPDMPVDKADRTEEREERPPRNDPLA